MARKSTKAQTDKTEEKTEVTPEVENTEVKTDVKTEETQDEQIEQKAQTDKTEEKTEVAPEVEKLMKLYPNLEKMWVTQQGFVHPENVPEYLRKGAKLYVNKYYKQ